jgi:alpha-D-ribose 1-methylphosphonate 5-triphosphate synthase subunit PhnG
MEQVDYILCECALEPLEAFVRGLEQQCVVQVIRQPQVATTMIRAEDSVEGQAFYLAEALITETEVNVDGQPGYGLCLGDEPVRSYCIAVIDALVQLSDARLPAVNAFLKEQEAYVAAQTQSEHKHIQRTKVDFKLMEEE